MVRCAAALCELRMTQVRSLMARSFWSATGIAISGQVQHRKLAIYGLSVTLRMRRVKSDKSDWFWSQSIVFTKSIKTELSLDLARGPDFQRMIKGTPGDEVAHDIMLAQLTV